MLMKTGPGSDRPSDTIDSFWSMIKRGIVLTFHKVNKNYYSGHKVVLTSPTEAPKKINFGVRRNGNH